MSQPTFPPSPEITRAEAIDLLRLQAGPLSRLITHTFGLDEYREALDLAEHGRETAMKVAFTFDGAEAGA